MGWEERSGRRYYYRKERGPDGSVHSVYVGSGWLAGEIARLDELTRETEELIGARLRLIREEGCELMRAFDALAEYVRAHTRVALLLEGFRTHKGQWRRRRYPMPETEPMPKKNARSAKPTLPAGRVPMVVTFERGNAVTTHIDGSAVPKEDFDAALDLIKRCDKADPKPDDLHALRRWMERDGVMIRAEELARAVHAKAVASHKNAFSEEATLAGIADLLDRMGYREADATEALLIMQVATAWVMLQGEQKNYERVTTGTYSLTEAEACDKRVSRAHSRFLRAVESLEKVRALRTVTAMKAGEATPQQRAAARTELARRDREKAQRPPALPPHAGDGAAPPSETIELSATA